MPISRPGARWSLIAAAAATGLCLTLYLTPPSAPATMPQPAPDLPHATVPDDGDLQRLGSELAELRAQMAALTGRPAPVTATSATPAAPDTDDVPPEERAARARARAQRTTEALERVMADSSRDPAWSADAERSIRTTFTRTALADTHLDEAYCVSTMCRVQIRFDTRDARERNGDAALDAIPWTTRGYARPSPDDPLRMVVYAARERDMFPDFN